MSSTKPAAVNVGRLPKSSKDAIEALHWAMRHFGSLTTNRYIRRRDVLRLVDQGIAESVGNVVLCDDDGFHVEPERYGEGFKLTEFGVQCHEALMKWYAAQRGW